MMNDPIVVWPPGTFWVDCYNFGNFYDCSYNHPEITDQGGFACCPAW